MKYFLDTEFIEYQNTIDLISIGIVAEDGREYYAENEQCDFSKQDDWEKRFTGLTNVVYEVVDSPSQVDRTIEQITGHNQKILDSIIL